MRGRAVCAAFLIAAAAPGAGSTAWAGPGEPIRTAQLAAPISKSAAKKSAPAAKAQPNWRFLRGAGLPTLEYGMPGGDTVISLSCQTGTGLVRVLAHAGSRGPRPGDGAAIRLSSGRNKFEIAGTAFSIETGSDVAIAGTTQIDGRLFTLLRGETTVLEVQGKRRALPLANGRGSIDAFEKACGEGR